MNQFIQITKERWYAMLEVLPPEKWETVDGVEIFRLEEYTIGNITGHYAKYRKTYWYALKANTYQYSSIASEVKESYLKICEVTHD
jgi:predicted CoA-binding protein